MSNVQSRLDQHINTSVQINMYTPPMAVNEWLDFRAKAAKRLVDSIDEQESQMLSTIIKAANDEICLIMGIPFTK